MYCKLRVTIKYMFLQSIIHWHVSSKNILTCLILIVMNNMIYKKTQALSHNLEFKSTLFTSREIILFRSRIRLPCLNPSPDTYQLCDLGELLNLSLWHSFLVCKMMMNNYRTCSYEINLSLPYGTGSINDYFLIYKTGEKYLCLYIKW